MFESNQTLQMRVYCKYHLHKDKRCSWRATTATTGAGAAAAEVITAVLFDAAGLSTFFFLEPDARAEDGEERIPSPSLLRFLDGWEEAAGISIKCYEMSYWEFSKKNELSVTVTLLRDREKNYAKFWPG